LTWIKLASGPHFPDGRPWSGTASTAYQAQFRRWAGGRLSAWHSEYSDNDLVLRRPGGGTLVRCNVRDPDRALGARPLAECRCL